jgi:LysM repeat protein
MARALTETPDAEPRNITARVLAPLALIACGLALFLLISEGLSGDEGGDGAGDRARPRAERAQDNNNKSNKPELQGDTYVVVPGDTLSGIAVKAGVPLARLERLNPDIDAATLNAGQTIKLR